MCARHHSWPWRDGDDKMDSSWSQRSDILTAGRRTQERSPSPSSNLLKESVLSIPTPATWDLERLGPTGPRGRMLPPQNWGIISINYGYPESLWDIHGSWPKGKAVNLLFIHPSVNEDLGCFHLLVTMDEAAIKILAQDFFGEHLFFSSLGWIPRRGITRSSSGCKHCKKSSFQKWWYQFAPMIYEPSGCSTFSCPFSVVRFLILIIPVGVKYLLVVSTCISLMATGGECLSTRLPVILVSFLPKCPCKSLAHFIELSFYHWFMGVFNRHWIQIHKRYMCYDYVFLICGLYF